MSSVNTNYILALYQYANKTHKTEANQAGFASYLQQTSEKTAVNCDMQTFLQNNRNCSLDEFTARYEKELEARGISGIDYAALVKGADSFSEVFSDYQVIEKVGNCKVSTANWERNDFPFWKFFDKNTSTDALNDWKPSGSEPDQSDPVIQKNVSQIGSGKISLIIPEALQKKMDADPAYAEEIYAKVAKWKDDYDRWDNTTAAALGLNVAEHQFSKSYCLQLDEEGNVQNYTVTSGGEVTQSDDKMVRAWYKRHGITYSEENDLSSFLLEKNGNIFDLTASQDDFFSLDYISMMAALFKNRKEL